MKIQHFLQRISENSTFLNNILDLVDVQKYDLHTEKETLRNYMLSNLFKRKNLKKNNIWFAEK